MFEPQDEHPSQWKAIEPIAQKFGMAAETPRKRLRQVEVDEGGACPGVEQC